MKLRLLKKGFVLLTRAKRRFIIFTLVYFVVFSLTLNSLNFVDAFQTSELLEVKGIVLKPRTTLTVDDVSDLVEILNEKQGVSRAVVIWYVRLSDLGAKVFAISPDKIWCLREVNPSTIEKGRYIARSGEAVISDENKLRLGTDGSISLGLGSRIKIGDIEFNIVGFYDRDVLPSDEEEWIVAWEEDVIALADQENLKKYVYSIVVLVEGFFWDAWKRVDQFGSEFEERYSEDFYPPEYSTYSQNVARFQPKILMLIYAVIGAVVVGVLFTFLNVRWRKRTLAILRAVGWSGSDLGTLVISENLGSLILGFLIALFLLVSYRTLVGFIFIPLGPLTVVLSFFVVLLSQVPGMKIAFSGVLKVKPVEALRKVER